jgi:hypothetical protein
MYFDLLFLFLLYVSLTANVLRLGEGGDFHHPDSYRD